MISDALLKRMREGKTTLGDVASVAEVLGGRAPLVRAKYVSSCCRGPVDVYHGKIQNPDGTPYTGGKDWQIPIVRRCAVCGRECEGVPPEETEP